MTEIIDVSALHLPEDGDAVDWLRINPNAGLSDLLSLPFSIVNADVTSDNSKDSEILYRRMPVGKKKRVEYSENYFIMPEKRRNYDSKCC